MYTPAYKVVIVGDSSVGKSSLVDRIVLGRFNEGERSPTIGAAFMRVGYPRMSPRVYFELWDCAGQERYMSLTPMYFRRSSVVLLVYESGNRFSYTKATTVWYEELKKTITGDAPPLCILIENKSDIAEPDPEARVEAAQFATKNGMEYVRTSAKTGDGVDSLLKILAERVAGLPPIPVSTLRVAPTPSSKCAC